MTNAGLFLSLTSVVVFAAAVGCKSTAERGTFESVIEVFSEQCLVCHSEVGKSGKLSLETVESILAGGKSGPAVVPGEPKASLLIVRLRALNGTQVMPQGGPPLPEEKIKLIELWIAAGAKP